MEAVPANRLAALARYGLAAKAPALRDLAEPRKTATLLATARHLEAAAMREALTARYGVVRPFPELLAEALPLRAAPAGEKLLAEVRRLPELARRRVKARHLSRDEVSAALVPAAWQRAVYRNPALPPDAADRDAYALCILEQLHRALRRRDIFASPSVRWADPRAQLLDGDGWHGQRAPGRAGAGAGRRMAGAGQDAPVRLVPEDDGRIRLAVDRLEAIGEPESLTPAAGDRGRDAAPGRPARPAADRVRPVPAAWLPVLPADRRPGRPAVLAGHPPRGTEGDYGPLNALARHRVSLAKIRTHWDDMTRVAGSLVTSQVRCPGHARRLSGRSDVAGVDGRRVVWGER